MVPSASFTVGRAGSMPATRSPKFACSSCADGTLSSATAAFTRTASMVRGAFGFDQSMSGAGVPVMMVP